MDHGFFAKAGQKKNKTKKGKRVEDAQKAVSSICMMRLKDFQILKLIRRTPESEVFLAKNKVDKELYALKRTDKMLLEKIGIEHQAFLERMILTELSHPGVVSLQATFQTEKFIWFVQDFDGRDTLADLTKRLSVNSSQVLLLRSISNEKTKEEPQGQCIAKDCRSETLEDLLSEDSDSKIQTKAPSSLKDLSREKSKAEMIDTARSTDLSPIIRKSSPLKDRDSFSEMVFRTRIQRRKLLSHLVAILEYCHNSGVAHLDIRPENLLVTRAGHLKLINFFNASFFQTPKQKPCLNGPHCFQILSKGPGIFKGNQKPASKGEKSELMHRRPCDYLPPEAFEQIQLGPPADLWGLGCLAYFLEVGTAPFKGATSSQKIQKIKECQVDFPPVRTPFKTNISLVPGNRPRFEEPDQGAACERPHEEDRGRGLWRKWVRSPEETRLLQGSRVL